ncbi:MAG: DUF192 domain-containing protein [Azospirillaceae bacterium]|nr:DUF192 domain-containing protein [Azospirillaceae bacterium]
MRLASRWITPGLTRCLAGVSVAVLIGLVVEGAVGAPDAFAQDTTADTAPEVTLPRELLSIGTRAGGRYRFTVEVATTMAQQARGLMFRRTLATDAGMLFVEQFPRTMTMWMENTLIPLDMLFIDRQGQIVNIAERATPLSQDTIPSAGPVIAVLELNGGTAARLGIRAGDHVVTPSLAATTAR